MLIIDNIHSASCIFQSSELYHYNIRNVSQTCSLLLQEFN